MRNLIKLLLLCIFIGSCTNNPPDPKELYEKYRNSVVLIKNCFYFAIHFDNGLHFYYTLGPDKKPIIHDSEKEAIEGASTMYGTGFFISDKGEIATNRHVVFPERESEKVGELINDYLGSLKSEVRQAINEKEVQNQKIEAFYDKYYSVLEFNQINDLKDEYLQKKNAIVDLETSLSALNFDPQKTKIEMITTSIGVTFDNTHVTSSEDFIPCVALKKSPKDELDLAIIQLKDKTTPNKVKDYFKLAGLNPKHKLSLNDKVYMIGFNMGPLIGQTNEGLKSQLTSGEVSQDPDSKRILYSIPTLQGSSGSPVMNQYGELVSVNFAKVSGEQSFCFGIPVIHLTELYNSTSVENEPEPFTSATVSENKGNYSTQSPNVTSGISDADYSHKIRSFIKAEEERDFDRIYQHFSPNFRRYWDITNPDYSSLKKRYEYIWSISSNGTNNIESIRKVTNSVYELHTNYSYYSSKKGRTINTYSEVRFVFDENGKIVETYDLN